MKRFILKIFIVILFFLGCEKNPVALRLQPLLWQQSSPETQGFDNAKLDAAFSRAKETGFMDALLVIRHGLLVAEQYYNGYNPGRSHNVMSVSKSFLSAVTGIAIQKGYLEGLDVKMLDYFPEYVYPEIDQRKYDITIRHLLTMRMGIPGEAQDNYGVYQSLYSSSNWIRETVRYPLVSSPGSQFHYNTFQTHLLAVIIARATGGSLRDFATTALLKPMGIDVDSWEQDPQGYYFGGNSMYFTPREMAVLGYLYLHFGNLKGVQLVPRDWVVQTLTASTNLSHPNAWGELRNYNYAWLWWLGQVGGDDMFMAYGYGGQYVMVFPSLDLIVVSTAANNVSPDTANLQEQEIFDIIAHNIVPAVTQ